MNLRFQVQQSLSAVITTAALLLSGILLTTTVSAAPQSAAYQLVFTTQPVNTTVGAKMASVVVQIKSQNGTNVPQSGTAILTAAQTV